MSTTPTPAEPASTPARPAAGLPALAVAVVLAGVAAGLAAGLVTLVLHAVMHLATGSGAEGFRGVPPWRRVVVATACGAVAGLAWWALRSRGPVGGLGAVQKDPTARMSLRRNTADAVITVAAVGSGMAVGRETAPRQIAAAATDHITRALRVRGPARVLTMCAAAAAGLAAVYNAPLAGVAYAAEVVVGRWSARLVAAAAATCAIGTVVAWPVVGNHPNLGYLAADPASWWWGLPVGLAAAALAPGYRRITERGRTATAPTGPRLVASLSAVGLLLGLLSLWLPALAGNGRATFGAVVHEHPGIILLAALLVTRPLLTSAFLGAGAVGGVLAPALAAGACAGGLVAHLGGAPHLAPALAVAGAGSTLSLTQRAPLFGTLLAWEMTHPDVSTTLALALATVVAQVVTLTAGRAATRLRSR